VGREHFANWRLIPDHLQTKTRKCFIRSRARTESDGPRPLIPAFKQVLDAESHTPVYMMHKYFARRPWNVFRELISHYSKSGEIVLDPFCGGGVTAVEALKLRRKVIAVDVNPIASYVTDMECRFTNLKEVAQAFATVSRRVKQQISQLYSTRCSRCGGAAIADWIEWDENRRVITRLKFICPACGTSDLKRANPSDLLLAKKIERNFARTISRKHLWYPQTPIPAGDKTNSLLNQKVRSFHELFTRRNLLALSILLKEIDATKDSENREMLRFAFSSSLKWASRQSHLRGHVVEGWAMHAYWIYPKTLEINVWNTFERRMRAVLRGKEYSNREVGDYVRPAGSFNDLTSGDSSFLILTQSSSQLPIPDESVDAVVTDPPYGGNVNYGELSDFWHVWLSRGKTIDKRNEIVVNRTQRKSLHDYEKLLHEVFTECYRVLKPERYLVSTFNSNDIRVVASFVISVSRAGFTLHPEGIHYQKPIRSYNTTIHAMQIGAFVGDFIFTFIKKPTSKSTRTETESRLEKLKESLNAMTSKAVDRMNSEPELRREAYGLLIPFLARYAQSDIEDCQEAGEFFEFKMRELEPHFKKQRTTITAGRKREYEKTRRA